MTVGFAAELRLGQDLLDRQHALLFERLDAAVAALEEGYEALDQAVGRFADALMEHLAAEEALMEESLWPERVRHKAAHELFTQDFLQFRAELREQGSSPMVAEWIKVRIPEWLRFHIRVNDAPFAAHLARRRPQPGDVKVRRDGNPRRLS